MEAAPGCAAGGARLGEVSPACTAARRWRRCRSTEFPPGTSWQYEPKWDGFRCLAFRDGTKSSCNPSREAAGALLSRYGRGTARALKAKQFVLDGEIVVPMDGRLLFDDLLMRIHPAASRVKKLAAETRRRIIVFDLLADARRQARSLTSRSLSGARTLETFARPHFSGHAAFALSPATPDWRRQEMAPGVGGEPRRHHRQAARSPLSLGRARRMQKIKRRRTADCVVGGFRYAEGRRVSARCCSASTTTKDCSIMSASRRASRLKDRRMITRFEALIRPPGFTGQQAGRSQPVEHRRSSEWQP